MIMQGDRYQSDDSTFHKWSNKGPMIGHGEHGGQWWIPVPKQADGTPAPPEVGNYLVNVNGGATYEFGQYDPSKETFTPSTNVTTAKLEGGQGGWWGAQQANDRMMMIGWALGDYHGAAGPGINFLTRLTLLREVHFDKKTNTLVSNPVPELTGLHTGTIASEKSVHLAPNAKHTVSGTDGGAASSADVNIKFSGLGADDVFGVCVLANLGISIAVTTVNNERFATVSHGPCSTLGTPEVGNAPVQRVMNGTDMPGNDYSVKHHDASFGYQGCQKACDADAKCVAWTWVVRGEGSKDGAGDCCLKDYQSCPDKNAICISGAKKASTNAPCGRKPGPPPGPKSGGGFPLFDETEVTVRVTPDRSVADFFVQGGRWSGTIAWLDKTPRASSASAVSVWSKKNALTADVEVFGMGCGWAYPSYTDKPTM